MSLGVQVAIKRVLPRRHGSESGRDLRVVECAVASARGSHRIRPGGAGRDGGLDSSAANDRRDGSRAAWETRRTGHRTRSPGRIVGRGKGIRPPSPPCSAVTVAGSISGAACYAFFTMLPIPGEVSRTTVVTFHVPPSFSMISVRTVARMASPLDRQRATRIRASARGTRATPTAASRGGRISPAT